MARKAHFYIAIFTCLAFFNFVSPDTNRQFKRLTENELISLHNIVGKGLVEKAFSAGQIKAIGDNIHLLKGKEGYFFVGWLDGSSKGLRNVINYIRRGRKFPKKELGQEALAEKLKDFFKACADRDFEQINSKAGALHREIAGLHIAIGPEAFEDENLRLAVLKIPHNVSSLTEDIKNLRPFTANIQSEADAITKAYQAMQAKKTAAKTPALRPPSPKPVPPQSPSPLRAPSPKLQPRPAAPSAVLEFYRPTPSPMPALPPEPSPPSPPRAPTPPPPLPMPPGSYKELVFDAKNVEYVLQGQKLNGCAVHSLLNLAELEAIDYMASKREEFTPRTPDVLSRRAWQIYDNWKAKNSSDFSRGGLQLDRLFGLNGLVSTSERAKSMLAPGSKFMTAPGFAILNKDEVSTSELDYKAAIEAATQVQNESWIRSVSVGNWTTFLGSDVGKLNILIFADGHYSVLRLEKQGARADGKVPVKAWYYNSVHHDKVEYMPDGVVIRPAKEAEKVSPLKLLVRVLKRVFGVDSTVTYEIGGGSQQFTGQSLVDEVDRQNAQRDAQRAIADCQVCNNQGFIFQEDGSLGFCIAQGCSAGKQQMRPWGFGGR